MVTRYDSRRFPNELASRARLEASAAEAQLGRAPAVVLVEGSSDTLVFKRLLLPAPESLVLNPPPGRDSHKQAVAGAVAQLVRLGLPAVGIVDGDCDHVLGRTVDYPPHLIPTDMHDIETTVLAAPSMPARLLRSLAPKDPKRRREFDRRQREADGPIAIIVSWYRAAAPLGEAKLMRARGQIRQPVELDPSGVPYERFVTIKDGRLRGSYAECVTATVGRAGWLKDGELDAIREAIHEAVEQRRESELPLVCRGHDVAAIGAIHLTRTFEVSLTRQDLEYRLRRLYEPTDFALSAIHSALRAWEEAAPGRRVLPSAGSKESAPGGVVSGDIVEVTVVEVGSKVATAKAPSGARISIDRFRLALAGWDRDVRPGSVIRGELSLIPGGALSLIPLALVGSDTSE